MSRHRPRGPSWRFQLRWLWDSPMVLVVWVAAFAAMIVVARTALVVQRAVVVRQDAETAIAELAAEDAARQLAARPEPIGSDGVAMATAAGVCCFVRSSGGDRPRWTLVLELAGRQRRFQCEYLPGAAAAALARPFTGRSATVVAAAAAPPMVVDEVLPRLRPDLAAVAVDAVVARVARVDDGIALLRLPTGTERKDFVLGSTGGDVCRIEPPASGVVVVAGHLWIDAGNKPLTIELAQDLTVVVHGNLYCGRSLRVVGPGRLLFVTTSDGGNAYRDRDGNGRWSTGDELLDTTAALPTPMEGAGNVWFGLPGPGLDAFEVDAGVLVAGELHLATDRALVHGPLVLWHGSTRVGGRAGVLQPTGRHAFDVEAERVPGFATTGAPRAGRLRSLEDHRLPLVGSPRAG